MRFINSKPDPELMKIQKQIDKTIEDMNIMFENALRYCNI